jgi:hypothetical protein
VEKVQLPFNRASVSRELLARKLPEWLELERLCLELSGHSEIHDLGTAQGTGEESLPLIAITMGSRDPTAPVLGLFAGVHGLERIGTQVCLSLLNSLNELLLWDVQLQDALKKIRIIAFPLINPLGMMHLQRSNPNGVDLMRNAPVEAEGSVPWLLGGQRLSPKIPWYRGLSGQNMEPENQAVLKFCRTHFFQSPTVITVDFHSGFGTQDQLWFPYAKSTTPFPHLPEMHALKKMLELTHPHHFYRIEPQAQNYTTHGDLWDYIYDLYRAENSGVYLPLAVEMGSWIWVKKNPLQAFSLLGPFNPIKPHRQKRILRRHSTLTDFLIRALGAPAAWAKMNPEQRHKHQVHALDTWYGSSS